MRRFKLVLLGDSGSGKSTFLKRHSTGEFTRRHIPTVGVDVTDIQFNTTQGMVTFEVWDTPGHEKVGGLRDTYYQGADCAIILYDLENKNGLDSVQVWYNEIITSPSISRNTPICICGNKVDLMKGKSVNKKTIREKENLKHFLISAKNDECYELPFLWILGKLFRDSNIKFTLMPAINPTVVEITSELRKQLEEDRRIAIRTKI